MIPGVKTELVLMPEADQKCFCVGGKDKASVGSPLPDLCTSTYAAEWGGAGQCTTNGGKMDRFGRTLGHCCIDHALGFSRMVAPATQFVLDVI